MWKVCTLPLPRETHREKVTLEFQKFRLYNKRRKHRGMERDGERQAERWGREGKREVDERERHWERAAESTLSHRHSYRDLSLLPLKPGFQPLIFYVLLLTILLFYYFSQLWVAGKNLSYRSHLDIVEQYLQDRARPISFHLLFRWCVFKRQCSYSGSLKLVVFPIENARIKGETLDRLFVWAICCLCSFSPLHLLSAVYPSTVLST